MVEIGEASLAAWRQQLMCVAGSAALLGSAQANPRVAAQVERLLLDLLVDGHASTAAAALRADPAPAFVRRAQEYVDAHFVQPLQLADLARAAGVPERTLRDGFLRFRGVSPMQYLRQIRLDKARERLRGAPPGLRIADVALDCGFTHLGRFALAYRERFGELPSGTVEGRV